MIQDLVIFCANCGKSITISWDTDTPKEITVEEDVDAP